VTHEGDRSGGSGIGGGSGLALVGWELSPGSAGLDTGSLPLAPAVFAAIFISKISLYRREIGVPLTVAGLSAANVHGNSGTRDALGVSGS